MTLREGKPGMKLKVESIGDSDLKQRLMTMGVIPGTTIKVLRSAPLGDPIAISLRSYNLAMRRADAERIQVQQVS
ncbi:MAG: ferrous iron transport protein A [Selenomonadaceae bacterium]|nr:ferrous iron transport protein A [Selenomonadaceae bacterium]MDY2686369.1 ferrous iron transport protein A [Selenomonadaceae bacterium]